MFEKVIGESRQILEASAIQSAQAKLSKARTEKVYAVADRKKVVGGAKGTREIAANRYNKAQRRLGKAQASEPEESK